jgi:hypothetical protein
LPAIAESTWHGACLASAEMARRGLVAVDKLTDLIEWLSKVGEINIELMLADAYIVGIVL